MKTRDLLQQRGSEYGEAWWITGQIVRMLKDHDALGPIIESGYFYNWITILCKLIRVLRSPHHVDSWRDIIGYSQLILDRLAPPSGKDGYDDHA